MESGSVCMRAIFSGLSEKNRGIGRLTAKSMKIAQEPAQPPAALQKRQNAAPEAAGTFICTLGISLRLIL